MCVHCLCVLRVTLYLGRLPSPLSTSYLKLEGGSPTHQDRGGLMGWGGGTGDTGAAHRTKENWPQNSSFWVTYPVGFLSSSFSSVWSQYSKTKCIFLFLLNTSTRFTRFGCFNCCKRIEARRLAPCPHCQLPQICRMLRKEVPFIVLGPGQTAFLFLCVLVYMHMCGVHIACACMWRFEIDIRYSP